LAGISRTRWGAAALAASFGAVITPYLIALYSPLRLSPDSVTYLSLADGIRVLPGAQKYPPGFPILLRFAQSLGLGSAWGFVAMNLILLGVAVFAFYRLCRQPLGLTATRALLACIALLLAYQVSQSTPAVFSDVPYLALAMLCLLGLETAARRAGHARVGLLILGGATAAIAVSIRIEALALVPPLVFAAVGRENWVNLWRWSRRHPVRTLVAAVPLLTGLLAVTVLVVRASGYGSAISNAWRPHGDPLTYLGHVIVSLHTRLYSLATIDTQGHCCTEVSHVSVLLPLAGGVFLLVLVALGWILRRRLGAIELFVLSTAAIILVYGAQARFWLAALPFMIVYAWFGLERVARSRPGKVAVAAYAAAYAITGALWLVNSVEVSTSGASFPSVWASQLRVMYPAPMPSSYLASYSVAFGKPRPRQGANVIPAVVELLRRYEPLARQPARRSAAAGLHNEPSRVRKRG
jgi:hypothetical protein